MNKSIMCAAQAVYSLIFLYILYFLRPRLALESRQAPAGLPDVQRRPLILVHPAVQNAGSWYFYQRSFGKNGYNPIHHFDYSCREASLEAAGERLAGFINEVIRKHPEENPVIICASLGGLLARAALTRVERPEALGGFITLACPHQGSRLARLIPKALFPLLHDIAYQSRAIQELEARESAEPLTGFPRTAFHSELDELVRPAMALRPPPGQGWRVEKTGPISHMHIMLHRPTIDRVVQEVARFGRHL